MKQLNRDLLINFITAKLDKYNERREAAKLKNDIVAINDYDIRMMPLYNLLIRIDRGEFDIVENHNDIRKPNKRNPKKTKEDK
jgi:hypothetical protein